MNQDDGQGSEGPEPEPQLDDTHDLTASAAEAGDVSAEQAQEIADVLVPLVVDRVVPRLEAKMSLYYEEFVSPVIPPRVLADYERVLTGLANRIVTMAEEQASHRQYLERRVVDSNVMSRYVGQGLAALLGICGILCATYLISVGKDISGLITLFVSVGGLALAHVAGRQSEAKELGEKRRTLPTIRRPRPDSPPADGDG